MPRKVALFIPCFIDQAVPQAGLDTVRVLRRVGCELEFPSDQTCCGQPAFNTGYWEEARAVAERFVRIFARAETIVCPSASCAAMVRNFYPELLASSSLRDEAAQVAARLFEFSEFLVDVLKVSDVGACFPHRVTYHDSCHAARELRVKEAPRELLRRVRGLTLVELRYGEDCCGFGGTFSVKYGMISAAMGESKAENVDTSGAEFVTSTDSSCLLHIEGVLRRKHSPVRALHLASVLAEEE
jgi:L-lactate dehydrogenase complex protein LldE